MATRESLPEPAPAPTRDEEREALARLLRVPEIARSANLVRLLSFICERYFEGRADEIRESAIAVQALGRRKDGFDSQVDPIVRVTARTLRKRLDDYYAHEGGGDALRLVLPTGQYVPQFVRTTTGSPGAQPRGSERARSRPDALRVTGALAALLACAGAGYWLGRHSAAPPRAAEPAAIAWGAPTWSDEFDGRAGAPPDPGTWAYDVGNNGGWGNHEVEVYCAAGSALPPCDPAHPNAFEDGRGNLVIRAIHTPSGGWTSARLKTIGLREFQYGRIEARMKLPVGAGLWSAFWMLGADIASVGWPQSGSIDVVENVANDLGPNTVRATIHGPGYSGPTGMWQDYTLPAGGRVDDARYHVYGILWSPQMLQYYVDDPGNVVFIRTASDVPAGRWAFDHSFFLLLSLAVGGQWPGPPDATTPNPSEMLVDYVRFYQTPPVPAPTLQASAVRVRAGQVATTRVNLTAASGSGRAYVACTGAPLHAACTLSSAVASFANGGTDTTVVTLTTAAVDGSLRATTPPGEYALTLTAVSASGATSRLALPLVVLP